MDNGARRALIPLENKRNFLDVSCDSVERIDPSPFLAALWAYPTGHHFAAPDAA